MKRDVVGMRVCAMSAVVGGLLAGAAALGVAQPAQAARGVDKADKIVVVKSERKLYLVRGGQILGTYRVALGRQPKGTKLYQGDGRTPEGSYSVAAFNPGSQFYRSIRVSYPNEQDRVRAQALGQSVGGDIMIHGLAPERLGYGADHWLYNWTSGCIAVTNEEIDEIWQRVEIGTPIEIRP
jgi:murein L,D-transpeptidase YafK